MRRIITCFNAGRQAQSAIILRTFVAVFIGALAEMFDRWIEGLRIHSIVETWELKPVSDFKIYHNPRCSKSRQTLALLEENGIEPELILYLETPPSAAQLAELVSLLGIAPRQLLRKGEDEFKANNLQDEGVGDDQILQAMSENPILIERPIVVSAGRAVLGRPPESVLALI